ncbi:MAG: hypothetical protein EOP81_01950 [Variovorax sp.]|nr:MAG: hypothetical protein EOP81_01950 [Variovorax sp.]
MKLLLALLIGTLFSPVGALTIKYSEDVVIEFAPRSSVVTATAARTIQQVVERAGKRCSASGIELVALEAVVDPRYRAVASDRNSSLRKTLTQFGTPGQRIHQSTFEAQSPPDYLRSGVRSDSVHLQLVCTPSDA